MIERKFVRERIKEKSIRNFIESSVDGSSYSGVTILKTPLGMKITIHSSKPGLIVGQGGQNIKKIQNSLIKKFGFENPVLEVSEVKNPELDAQIMCERVSYQLTRWGVQRFKKIGYNILERIMKAGAKGGEVVIGGKVPGKRATTWRFRGGFLPKTGAISDYEVKKGFASPVLKTGVIGIWVSILNSDVIMPDEVKVLDNVSLKIEADEFSSKIVKGKRLIRIGETEIETSVSGVGKKLEAARRKILKLKQERELVLSREKVGDVSFKKESETKSNLGKTGEDKKSELKDSVKKSKVKDSDKVSEKKEGRSKKE